MLGEPDTRFFVVLAQLRKGDREAMHRLFKATRVLAEFGRSSTAVDQELCKGRGISRSQCFDESLGIALCGGWMLVHVPSISQVIGNDSLLTDIHSTGRAVWQDHPGVRAGDGYLDNYFPLC